MLYKGERTSLSRYEANTRCGAVDSMPFRGRREKKVLFSRRGDVCLLATFFPFFIREEEITLFFRYWK